MSNSNQQLHNHDDALSPGAWSDIAICIALLFAWLLRYSYLASPSWFLSTKSWLGIRPSKRTPISHEPVNMSNESQESCITTPEQAHIRHEPTETLPVYCSTSRFSMDVLGALGRLEASPGTRPPSYRSQLSTDSRRAMGRVSNADEEAGAREPGDAILEVRLMAAERQTLPDQFLDPGT